MDQTKKPQAMKGKIFGIGLSRTGTTSLTAALNILGFSAIHFPTRTSQIDAHDAATDTPVALAFRELELRYPDSKFILTVRDKKEWLKSCEQLWTKHSQNFESKKFIRNLHSRLYGGIDFDHDRFSKSYDHHVAAVHQHFKGRPSALLDLDIFTSENPWKTLCPFLDVPIPEQPFPHQNSKAIIDEILLRIVNNTNSASKAAELAQVSPSYVEALLDKGHGPDFTNSLKLDGGDEASKIVRNLIESIGTIKAAEVLDVDSTFIDALNKMD
ncbi:MAG: hypothetical protein JKY12_07680 [Sneathiella sp.]|nr:hypothetical protein [Sneathiella sp.]